MPLVVTEDRGPVRHIVLNRPEKRNAFNDTMILELRDAAQYACDDPDVRVVVLRGEGRCSPRAWTSRPSSRWWTTRQRFDRCAA